MLQTPVPATCTDTEHHYMITKWEVKTAERRIVPDVNAVEAETLTTQRAVTLVCQRCAKVQAAPPK